MVGSGDGTADAAAAAAAAASAAAVSTSADGWASGKQPGGGRGATSAPGSEGGGTKGIATSVAAGGDKSSESGSWSPDPSRDAVAAVGSG